MILTKKQAELNQIEVELARSSTAQVRVDGSVFENSLLLFSGRRLQIDRVKQRIFFHLNPSGKIIAENM